MIFLSTLSLRRATLADVRNSPNNQISIHALLAESDSFAFSSVTLNSNFYPRSPCGERPDRLQFIRYIIKFLSTLSLRRATFLTLTVRNCSADISIHALLAESDRTRSAARATFIKFLSTLSLRRATRPRCYDYRPHLDFYPRSPCGERPSTPAVRSQFMHFYPRSPCGERR